MHWLESLEHEFDEKVLHRHYFDHHNDSNMNTIPKEDYIYFLKESERAWTESHKGPFADHIKIQLFGKDIPWRQFPLVKKADPINAELVQEVAPSIKQWWKDPTSMWRAILGKELVPLPKSTLLLNREPPFVTIFNVKCNNESDNTSHHISILEYNMKNSRVRLCGVDHRGFLCGQKPRIVADIRLRSDLDSECRAKEKGGPLGLANILIDA